MEFAVEIAAKSLGDNIKNAELAYFGGSFTAIDRDYMLMLLKTGAELTEKYGLKGIRISTRPDAIDRNIIEILKENRVTSVELGAQSMSDRVLEMNSRGHSSQDVRAASQLINESKLELGLQMMTGLYGSGEEDDYNTAVEITKLCPKTVRIYPTIVLEDTGLCNLYKKGLYKPQELNKAVKLCSRLIPIFEDRGIKIIRVGLHSTQEISKNHVAGPFHPAFTELCRSRIFLDKLIPALGERREATVFVNPRQLSQALGQKRQNIAQLNKMGYNIDIKTSEKIEGDNFFIEAHGCKDFETCDGK